MGMPRGRIPEIPDAVDLVFPVGEERQPKTATLPAAPLEKVSEF